MRIAIAGTGYVGLSMAVLLAQHNTVTAVDIVPEKADLINRRISPIADSEIQEYLSARPLDLTATTDGDSAYRNAELVLISTPTNYDPDQNYFDTSSVESVIRQVMAVNPSAAVVIRSTVPVGFTESARIKHGCRRLLFSPEFLREGRALYDNLYPSRIVVGVSQDDSQLRQTAEAFAALLREGAVKKDIPVRFMAPTEAEAVKLFANTYLALRVSYFNELDTYAQVRGLDTRASRSSTVSALTRVSAATTIIPASATAATACPRTPSSCWLTTVMCPRTSSPPSWRPTAPARTSSRSRSWPDTPGSWASTA